MTIPVGPRIEQSNLRESVEINANATPGYLINDNLPHIETQPANIGANLSTVGKLAQAQIKLVRLNNLLNYIPNISIGDSNPPPPPPPSPPVPSGGTGTTGSTGSTGSTGPTGSTDSTGSAGGTSGLGGSTDVESATEDLINEADDQSNAMLNQDWTMTDPETGYEYIDPNFYVEFQKLTAILNALQVIGMVIDSLRDIKQMILDAIGVSKEEKKGQGGGVSVSETLGNLRELGMLRAQGQQTEMNEAVMTQNQKHLQEQLDEAKRNADGSWYDYASEVVTSGGSDAHQRHADARYADAAYAIMQKYEQFQDRVQKRYEDVLTKSSLFNDGITKVGDVIASLTSNALLVDIGGGKVDVNRDKLVADQMHMTGLENYRRIFFMIQQAKQELKKIIYESFSGMKSSANAKRVLSGMCDALDQYENMAFSALTYQLQNTIAAQNGRVDAYNQKELAWAMYDSSIGGLPGLMTLFALASGDYKEALASLSPFGGSVPLIGGLTKNISDYFALLWWNKTIDDVTNPTQLNMNRVYQFIADMVGTTEDKIREEFDSVSGDKYSKQLGELERRQWEILGQLNQASAMIYHSDGTVEINEEQINALREQLDSVQNMARIIEMVGDAIERVKRAGIKIMTGIGDVEGGGEGKAALKSSFETVNTAFDLKFAGIKAQAEAINKEVKEQKQLEKAGYVALGSAALSAVAIVLMAAGVVASPFTGGLSLVAAIGFVAACGQLGASLGQLIWNGLNPVDYEVYDQTQFYYEKTLDSYDKQYAEQIDRLTENAHVDAENSSDPLRAGNQWARDTKLFMEVRNKLTQIYIYEQVMDMILKAQQDVKNAMIAGLTGVNLESDADLAQNASSANFANKIKAFDLKQEMIDDIISRRNARIDQETEMNWGGLQAAISVVSIVASGISFGTDVSAPVRSAAAWTAFGFELTGLAAQATKSLLDATSGQGELASMNDIRKLIDKLVQSFSLDDESKAILNQSLGQINASEMEVGTASGKVTVDSSKYYESMLKIQHYFNRVIALLKVAEAINRIKARIVGAPAVGGMSEVFDKAKADTIKQLDLLQDRVKVQAERTNAMADAWRQFTITVVMIVYKIIMKIAEKQGWITKLKQMVSDAVPDKGLNLVNDAVKANKIAQIITGNPNATWSGKITIASLINMMIDGVSSQSFIKMVTQKVFDAAAKKGKGTQTVSRMQQPLSTAETGSEIGRLEAEAFDNRLDLAEIGVDSATLDVLKRLKEEMIKFYANEIGTMVQSPLDESYDISRTVIKNLTERKVDEAALTAEEKKFYTYNKQLLVDIRRKFRLENVNWNNRQEVENLFAKIKDYLDKAKDVLGLPLNEGQKKILFEAIAIVIGERILKNDAYRQNAIGVLKNMFNTELGKGSAGDVGLMARAMAILGAMTKVEGKGKLSSKETGEIDSLINNVWAKATSGQISEEAAVRICENIRSFRNKAYEAGVTAYSFSKNPEMMSLPQEIAELSRTNLGTTDLTDATKVKENVALLQRMMDAKGFNANQKQNLVISAAVLTMERVAVMDAESRAKTKQTLINLARDPANARNAALQEYCNAVLGRMVLSDSSSGVAVLPRKVQIALVENTHPGSVDWTKPTEIREFFSRVQRFVKEGIVDGKPLPPELQGAVMSAVVPMVASLITPNGELNFKAVEAFAKIVKEQKSGPVVSFANDVLTRAQTDEETTAKKAIAKAESKVQPQTQISKLISRMNSRVLSMEWALFDRNHHPAEQLAKFKVDLHRFIEMARKLDIGVPADLLQRAAKAETPEEFANILENMQVVLNSPKLKLSDAAKKFIGDTISGLKAIDLKLRTRSVAGGAKAALGKPAEAAPRMTMADLDRVVRRPLGTVGQRVNARDSGTIVAVKNAGRNYEEGNQGSGSQGKGSENGKRQPQPQAPMFANANQVNTNGKPTNGNGLFRTGKEAAEYYASLGNHNGHSA